jgi:hypothetical protein
MMNLSLSALVLVFVSTLALYSNNSLAAPQNRDAQVIAQLAGVGSNLSKQHKIDFFFYFPTKEKAKRIAAKLHADGFSTSVEKSLSTHEYAIQAKKLMVPVESELVALREKFNILAASENGVYDGWGAEVAN